jgi:predicted RNA-binding protein with RPS1 domain
VGQIVKVQVLNADTKAKRIALSMKVLEAAPPEPKRKNFQKPPEKKQPSLQDQLSSLQSKFKVR